MLEWQQEPHLWNWPDSRLDRNWYLFRLLSANLRVVKRLQNYHSDGRWHFMKKYALLCVYSDICHRHFMLHRAINYFIERFGYFLVCSVINAVIINAVKHQKLTKKRSIKGRRKLFWSGGGGGGLNSGVDPFFGWGGQNLKNATKFRRAKRANSQYQNFSRA